MKPSILFVTNAANWPLTDGKRQRTWFLIEALSKKYVVDLLLLGPESEKVQVEKSKSSINNLYFVDLKKYTFHQPGHPSFLISKEKKKQNNLIYNAINQLVVNANEKMHYSYVFSRYLDPLLEFPFLLQYKTVCDIDDVYSEKTVTRIKSETDFLRKLKLKVLFFLGLKKVENVLGRIDFPIIVKKTDANFPKLKQAQCIPNLPFGFYVEKNENPVVAANLINSSLTHYGFIGKLSYRPNYDGLIDFITTVWNPLMEKTSNAKFIIAGSGVMPEVLKTVIANSKNIEVLGFVEKTVLFWDKIDVLIVPIAEGGGSNIKVAEAFMYGKSVMASPFASRGYEEFIASDFFILPEKTEDWITEMLSFNKTSDTKQKEIAATANTHFDLEKWNQLVLHLMP